MLMIGVSTGQNITNLIPAVQESLNIDNLILLETATANKHNWSVGISNVLERKKIKTEAIKLDGIDDNINEIIKIVNNRISGIQEKIIWNLGGGQKPQQIAIWELFKKRNLENKIPDIVCYANQDDKGILDIWVYENDKVIQKTENIDSILNAKDIFEVFGCELKGSPKKIYEKDKKIDFEFISDLFEYEEFREYFFKLPQASYEIQSKPLTLEFIREILNRERVELSERFFDTISIMIKNLNLSESDITDFKKNIKNTSKLEINTGKKRNLFNNAIKKNNLLSVIYDLIKKHIPHPIIELKNHKLKNVLKKEQIVINSDLIKELSNQKSNKSAEVFETLIAQRIKKLLENKEHNIIEAYTNFEIEKYGRTVAEYDVLCVTNKGTIIALDAKTFNFESKDIDARLYNLEQGSGFYRTFSAVFPYDYEDIGKDFFKPIQDLPIQLNKRHFSFYVINDSRKSNFWIKKNVAYIEKSLTKPGDEGWVECKTLESFIKN